MSQLKDGRPIEPPVQPGATRRILEHPIGVPEGQYQWVSLWQWPIRLGHWVAVVSILVLIATGFYIGRPYFLTQALATGSFSFQYARLFHFIAGGLLTAAAIFRVYWLIAGNRYERFKALFPVQKQDWQHLWMQIRYYTFIDHHEPHYVGHNPLQQLFYTSLYVAAIIMVLTGFALFGTAEPLGLIYKSFQWVTDLLGGLQQVRLIHHVVTWYFIMFMISHVYFAVRSDVLEHMGGMSSIFSGGKFVRKDVDYIDVDEQK